MSDNIPLDIQMEIIKKLPVKFVIQFRCVSKTWKSLIDGAGFISDYSGQENLLLMYEGCVRCERKYVTVVVDNSFPQQKLSPTIPLLVRMLRTSIKIGSSQGLLCLYGYYTEGRDGPIPRTDVAVVWNISIRKAIAVVLPKMETGFYHTALGFGVCVETNDPKIVKITYISRVEDMESVTCIPHQVEVFSLSTGAWRPLNCSLPRKSIKFCLMVTAVAVDGYLYWLATDRTSVDGKFRSLLISFDLKNEVFGEIYLPESLANLCIVSVLSIARLRESLVVLEHQTGEVWLMEDGVSKLFTKLFTVNLKTPDAIRCVYGFRTSGEPIITNKYRLRKNYAVAVYEPYTKCINDLGIDGIYWLFCVHSVMETLLLLHQPCSKIYK